MTAATRLASASAASIETPASVARSEVAAAGILLRVERHPGIGAHVRPAEAGDRQAKRLRHDAGHGVAAAVEREPLADDRRIAAETLPQPARDDDAGVVGEPLADGSDRRRAGARAAWSPTALDVVRLAGEGQVLAGVANQPNASKACVSRRSTSASSLVKRRVLSGSVSGPAEDGHEPVAVADTAGAAASPR